MYGRFEKGLVPWNKGLKAKDDERVKRCVEAAHTALKKGYKVTEKKRLSLDRARLLRSSNWRAKTSASLKGRKRPDISKMQKERFKNGELSIGLKGEENQNWKGGVTPINIQIRHSMEYKDWRRSVFERDNYQCVIGGKEHGSKLNADHIKSFASFPELRFDIDNGRTLCEDCHKKTDTYLKNIKVKVTPI
mgnify:CR=1 FL=1